MRAADRVMQMSAGRASSQHSQEILVDQAFLEIFGGITGGAAGRLLMVETYPDRIVARGMDGRLYEVNYTTGIDGVTFARPQEVQEPRL